MATERENLSLEDRRAALLATLAERLGDDITANPALADAVNRQIDALVEAAVAADAAAPVPPDEGLAQLVGIGPEAAERLAETRVPPSVQPYDETVASERIVAVADLYYIYQHERIGVFRAIQRLQELFRAGAVFLSSGQGAYKLYQFDRRQVLRYTRDDRLAAYRRAFGYGPAQAVRGARANTDFHPLFSNFNNQVALFWRDKRISDVLRERAYDPSFGSIAIVRRAGLDLRNNLKFMSYGHLNVLRVEVMQLLDEAFRILDAEDIKKQFGADTAWDVVEAILVRYFNERLATSPRQGMAVAGRNVLRWLAQPHVLEAKRAPFETRLLQIAESAEEWLTSAQSLGLARREPPPRPQSLPFERRSPAVTTGPAARVRPLRRAHANGSGP
ncbi:hypothetical protein AB0M28_32930 [Streptomyces sp. NPDC051940]|uniref:hypothetical protein n=1 Tax=Streptomyces sp. NPDC051940 TaxID=3155675 RepID=UPI003417AB9D